MPTTRSSWKSGPEPFASSVTSTISAASTAPTTDYRTRFPDLEGAIDEYYAARGWTSDGTVPDAALETVAPSAD